MQAVYLGLDSRKVGEGRGASPTVKGEKPIKVLLKRELLLLATGPPSS